MNKAEFLERLKPHKDKFSKDIYKTIVNLPENGINEITDIYEVLKFLEKLYESGSFFICKNCNRRLNFPDNRYPCSCGNTNYICIGTLGKSVQGSFEWLIARAKGEKV